MCHVRLTRHRCFRLCFSLIFLDWCMLFVLLNCWLSGCGATYDVCADDETGAYLACQPGMFGTIWYKTYKMTVAPDNATCGSPPSTYRRLGDRTGTMQVCDASSASLQHPPTYIVDSDTNSWWQSVNQASTSNDLRINITLSFNKTFIMAGDIIITFNSGRPERMVLEKSADYGLTWSPLQFYARNCSDFKSELVAGATVTVDNPTAVVCTNRSIEVVTRPPAGQKVRFSVDERFQLFLGPNDIDFESFYTALDNKLLGFLQFTDIRIKLIQPATDRRGNFDTYYYGISDFQVTSWCDCNLHAAYCNYTETDVVCDCQHHTTGKNCETCLPLYNQRPWQSGSHLPYDTGTANECIKCECHEHADSCSYNATYGRGICDTCLHNTRGYHCELCSLTYYPNMSLPLSDVNRCIECDCDLQGVFNNSLVCAQENSSTETIGQCLCRPLISGRRCDQCVPGYYGLKDGPTPGNCTACNCNSDGTVGQSNTCQQTGGQCPCKDNIVGRECDTCADSYFLFPTGNPQRDCLTCDCDKGGSVDNVCDKTSGQCSCRENITGEKCNQVIAGTFVPMTDTLIFEPQPGACEIFSDLYTTEHPFDGASFVVCNLDSQNLTVSLKPARGATPQIDLQWPYIAAVRYSSNNPHLTGRLSVQIKGDTPGDGFLFPRTVGQNISSACPLSTGSSHHVMLAFPSGQSAASLSLLENITLDARCEYSLTLDLYLANVTSPVRKKRAVLLESDSSVIIDSVLLLPGLSNVDGSVAFEAYSRSENQTAFQESYLSCLQQVASLVSRQKSVEQSPCQDLLFSLGAELYAGASACNCSIDGTDPEQLMSCQSLGGQCQCLPGVSGRTCDTCTPGYFNLTSSGCTVCPDLPCQNPESQSTTPTPLLLSTMVSSSRTDTANTTVASNREEANTTVASNTTETTNITVSASDKPLAGGFIALIVIAVVIFIVIFVISYLCWKRQKARHESVGHETPHHQLTCSNHQKQHSNNSPQKHHETVTKNTDLKEVETESVSSSKRESDSCTFVTYAAIVPAFSVMSENNNRSLDSQRSSTHTFSASDENPLSHSSPKEIKLDKPPPGKRFFFDEKLIGKLPRQVRRATNLEELDYLSPELYDEETRSDSLDVPSDKQKHLPSFPSIFDHGGHGLNQWSPVSDPQLSATNSDNPKDQQGYLSSSSGNSVPVPDLERQDDRRRSHADDVGRHEPWSPHKPHEKNARDPPQKPQRQKQKPQDTSIMNTILPPPPMYDSVYPDLTSNSDTKTHSDRHILLGRNRTPASYDNPVFLPDVVNSGFAGYNSFDEVNGSLV